MSFYSSFFLFNFLIFPYGVGQDISLSHSWSTYTLSSLMFILHMSSSTHRLQVFPSLPVDLLHSTSTSAVFLSTWPSSSLLTWLYHPISFPMYTCFLPASPNSTFQTHTASPHKPGLGDWGSGFTYLKKLHIHDSFYCTHTHTHIDTCTHTHKHTYFQIH